jgi:hypothetical protein
MALYLDTVMALKPLTFHRLQDTPSSSGAIVDTMTRQNMTFAASTVATQDPFNIPCYSTPPNTVEFGASQGATNRIGGSTNAIWDRGSSDRACSGFVWAKRPASVTNGSFPSILSIGDSTTGFAVYLNATISRIDSSHRLSGTPTGGTGTGSSMSAGSWALAGWRYSTSTGWQINVNGADCGSRINPTKWANGVMTAQFRPGTWGSAGNWEGPQADAAFFDYELTAQNFLDVYNAGLASPAGGIGGVFRVAKNGQWV